MGPVFRTVQYLLKSRFVDGIEISSHRGRINDSIQVPVHRPRLRHDAEIPVNFRTGQDPMTPVPADSCGLVQNKFVQVVKSAFRVIQVPCRIASFPPVTIMVDLDEYFEWEILDTVT